MIIDVEHGLIRGFNVYTALTAREKWIRIQTSVASRHIAKQDILLTNIASNISLMSSNFLTSILLILEKSIKVKLLVVLFKTEK